MLQVYDDNTFFTTGDVHEKLSALKSQAFQLHTKDISFSPELDQELYGLLIMSGEQNGGFNMHTSFYSQYVPSFYFKSTF